MAQDNIFEKRRKKGKLEAIQSGFIMSLSKELNAKRIFFNYGELDHVLDPQHEMGLVQQ